MTDNVIILGAGASADAGIPMLSNFVDRMLEFGIKKTNGNEALSDEDVNIFENALRVRGELDSYHGRASFDDRNIEDILSILSFNVLGGEKNDREKFEWITKAIARTIELTCKIKPESYDPFNLYESFWNYLFDRFPDKAAFPTIITFNYDLVLERALLRCLPVRRALDNPMRSDGIAINYHYNLLPNCSYKFRDEEYEEPGGMFEEHTKLIRTKVEHCQYTELERPINLELLKLHGSLNFPIDNPNDFNSLEHAVENPYLLPPVFNKWLTGNEQGMWRQALLSLKEAKNIIIIGYSMPRTDIYMQYFLKAGLGPNLNLNRIYVFNPELFSDGKDMQQRYEECFSPQLRRRIIFQPFPPKGKMNDEEEILFENGKYRSIDYGGTFERFVNLINWGDLFYMS